MGWIANTIGPVKVGSPTRGAVARAMVWVLLAAALAGLAAARAWVDTDAIRFVIPAVAAGLSALPAMAQLTEITISPGSLLIRAWWWQAFGDRPVEAWSGPNERWIGRTLHGKWFAGRHTIRLPLGEHRHFLATCEQAGIPIRDKRTGWQAAHPLLSLLRKFLWACAVTLIAAAILLLADLLIRFPGRIDWTWLGALGAGLALQTVGETIVELSARLDARFAPAALGSTARGLR